MTNPGLSHIAAPFTSVTVEIHGESTETFTDGIAISESTVDNAIEVYLATATVTLADGRTLELDGDADGWSHDGTVLSRFLVDAINDAIAA